MNNRFDFDALARDLASGLSRREALRRLGGGLAGALLVAFGFSARAEAGGNSPSSVCASFCSQRCSRERGAIQQCIDACLACGARPDSPRTLCGGCGSLFCTDLQSDVNNCGACDTVCDTALGAVCYQGVCCQPVGSSCGFSPFYACCSGLTCDSTTFTCAAG